MISKEEVVLWRREPVTQRLFATIVGRIDEAKDVLSEAAGMEPRTDAIMVGMIKAFREVLGVGPEDLGVRGEEDNQTGEPE
jgi:hypothetical protein